MPGYPWVPALYIASSAAFTGAIALDAPLEAAKGLGILAAGVVVYVLVRRRPPTAL
jgi:hypothetical protein